MLRMRKTMKRMSLSYSCCPMMMSFLSCSFFLRSTMMMNCRCSCCSLVMSCCVTERSTVPKVTMTLRVYILMCCGQVWVCSCCIPDWWFAPLSCCGSCCKTALSLPSGCHSSVYKFFQLSGTAACSRSDSGSVFCPATETESETGSWSATASGVLQLTGFWSATGSGV